MTLSSCRFRVTGRVQGVFFRASTARQARRLELTGYARNCTDGSVEVLVYGRPEAIAELGKWLWQGPPVSSVSDVVRDEVTAGEMAAAAWPPSSFSTG